MNATGRPMNHETTLAQIGRANVLAISGGRSTVVDDSTLALPVAQGYTVTVFLAGNDTYTVKRVYRGAVKGEVENVHAGELGETAYRASCYRDPFGGHRA